MFYQVVSNKALFFISFHRLVDLLSDVLDLFLGSKGFTQSKNTVIYYNKI